MRPKSVTVTSGNTPYYIPMDWRGGAFGITATPNSANYDVAYATSDIGDGAAGLASGDWTDITGMSAATTAAAKEVGPSTCIRITLNSGTSVKVDVVQSDIQ